MKFVRIIDENGLFVEDAFVEELTDKTIETPCPSGFYHPKWDGTKWVEGLTQAEIDAIKASVVVEPTAEERIAQLEAINADLIQVLVDKGVLY